MDTPLTLVLRESMSEEDNEKVNDLAMDFVGQLEGLPVAGGLSILELILGAILIEELHSRGEESAMNVIGLMSGLIPEAYTIAKRTVGDMEGDLPKDLVKMLRDRGITGPPK